MKYLSISCALLVIVSLTGCDENESLPQELTVVRLLCKIRKLLIEVGHCSSGLVLVTVTKQRRN